MSDGGKGDKQRPLAVSEEQFSNNWDTIFKKPVKTYTGGTPQYVLESFDEEYAKFTEELRKGALNPALRTYDGKLK